MIVTIVVAAVALALGLTAHHFLRRNDTDADDEGLSVRDLISPVQTLTVLILAFVLATPTTRAGTPRPPAWRSRICAPNPCAWSSSTSGR